MVSRRVFLKNGAFAFVTLGFAPSFVVTLDGDGQNDPAFIPALIRALERIDAAHEVEAAAVQPHWEFTPPDAGVGSAGLGDLLGDAETHGDAERVEGDPAERRR